MSPSGKVLKLKKGQLAFIGGMAVHARDGKIELYVYGTGEIIIPTNTRDHGPFDTRESIDKAWREVNGNPVDEEDLQGSGDVRRYDIPDRSQQDATAGLA
jgi:hypothetical protein